MSKSSRLIALLLCAAMLMGIVGCQTPAEPTTVPTTVPPTQPTVTEPIETEPPADVVYSDARAALDNATAVSLDIVITTTTTIADQIFTEQSMQVLTYAGLDTGTPTVSLEDEISYNIHEQDPSEDAEDDEDLLTYSEVYADGMLYAQLMDTYYFSSAITPEACLDRYVPVVLLDAALYSSITSEVTDDATTISFTEPTAAESWAVPDDAQMLDAFGSAVVSPSGALQQMNYTITYRYGSTEVKLEVESIPRAEAAAVTVPEDTDSYTVLQYADALRMYVDCSGMLLQSDSITVSSLESVVSHAAGVVRNQSNSTDIYGRKEDLMAKIVTNIYLMDYSTNQDQQLTQEETYQDGKYTYTVDDGVPTSQTGISYEDISAYCTQIISSHLINPIYWKDVTVEDLGSVYLLEFTLTEDFGDTIQNGICNVFWEDPAFLNKLASAYVTNETTGYISVDKYTGIPTAAGYYYEGTHTIEGEDYTLSLQSDQSFDAPSFGAYTEITEEIPPEEEPENKATPLFYHVTGENGQEMWLFGTIHVGDNRTGFLPQEIYDAFAASDALALEYNSEAFDEQLEEDDDLQDDISDLYYYSDGSSTADHVSGELYERAVKYMKASGNYTMNTPYMKVSLWSNAIDNFFLRQGYKLTGEKGVEERLTKLAQEQGKEILDIESGLFQTEMMTGWSEDLQEIMLEDSLEGTAAEYWEGVQELYELWCAGDEAALREQLSDEVDPSELTEEELTEYEAQKPYIDEYNKAMSYDRNDGMLQKAIEYLESGETVFYAVGLAHLLNDVNGLVDALREAGYTVELVTYQ